MTRRRCLPSTGARSRGSGPPATAWPPGGGGGAGRPPPPLPLPAVRHGCYRGSRAATVPLAAMGAVHRLLGTWRRCVDLFIAPSEFTRSKYIEAGWSLEKLGVKQNTAPEAGTLRADRPDGSPRVLPL